jgi:hypothetical protein
LLLDGRAIRRSRFHRRRPGASPPTSKIVKCIEFNANRTVDLRQTWSDWVLEPGIWATTTTNSSGWPSSAHVKFDWPQGAPNDFPDQQFVPDPDLNGTYRLDLRLGPEALSLARSLARRITLRFSWLGGAVLTKSDLAYFDPITLDVFRRRDQEFWAIHTRRELQSMSLLIIAAAVRAKT